MMKMKRRKGERIDTTKCFGENKFMIKNEKFDKYCF